MLKLSEKEVLELIKFKHNLFFKYNAELDLYIKIQSIPEREEIIKEIERDPWFNENTEDLNNQLLNEEILEIKQKILNATTIKAFMLYYQQKKFYQFIYHNKLFGQTNENSEKISEKLNISEETIMPKSEVMLLEEVNTMKLI